MLEKIASMSSLAVRSGAAALRHGGDTQCLLLPVTRLHLLVFLTVAVRVQNSAIQTEECLSLPALDSSWFRHCELYRKHFVIVFLCA